MAASNGHGQPPMRADKTKGRPQKARTSAEPEGSLRSSGPGEQIRVARPPMARARRVTRVTVRATDGQPEGQASRPK
jgi:hypothetical protein